VWMLVFGQRLYGRGCQAAVGIDAGLLGARLNMALVGLGIACGLLSGGIAACWE
jgi:hypothetical protein